MNLKNFFYTQFLLLLLWNMVVPRVCAQHHQFKTLLHEDGLSSSYVYQAEEDVDGYMWIATKEGIDRYDGKVVINCGPESGFTDGGSYKIFKDRRGQLWFISLNYHLYLLQNGKLKRILPQGRIVWIDEDDDGLYLLGREGDLMDITYTGEIIHTKKLTDLALYYGKRISRNEIIFTSARDVFIKKDTSTIKLNTYKYIYSITRTFKLADGRILLSNVDGIYQYTPENDSIRLIYPTHHTEIYSVYTDPENGDLWLSTTNGAYRFKNGIIDDAHLEKHFKEIINYIYKNPTGEMVFSSFGVGVHIGSLNVLYYTKEEGLRANELAAIRQNEKYIFIATYSGLLYCLKQKKIHQLSSNFEDSHVLFYQGAPRQPLYCSGRDTIWRIIDDRAVPAEKYMRRYTITTPGLKYIDPQGKKHFSIPPNTNYDPVKKQYFSVLNKEEDAFLLSILQNKDLTRQNMFNTPVPVDGKNFYLFLDKGLLRIHATSGNLSYIYDTVYASRPRDMIQLPDRNFVIATRNKGLDVLKGDDHHFYTIQNGLPSNTIYKLLYDKGILWASTGAGLVAIQLDNRDSIIQITPYRPGSYQTQEEVTDLFIDNDEIYIVSNKGLSLFNKKTLRPALNGLPVHFQRIRINEHDTALQDSFVLPYSFNTIELNYRAILFSTEKILYKYKLAGADDNWQYTDRENIAYAKLKPGTYRFIVYAKTENGGWGNKPQILYFTIHPPFWKTWWFITLEFLVFLGSIALISYRIIQINKKRNETRRRIVESELRAIRLHMNPHFIYNTLSSLQFFILDNQSEKANLYLSKFSRLVRLIMHYAAKKEISVTEEIDFLTRYVELEQMRFFDKFDFNIKIAENIDINATFLPPLVIQPFIENAIKYGINNKKGHGTVLLDISVREQLLVCVVEDDGIGRKKAQELKMGYKDIFESTGIKYTAERLRLLSDNVSNPNPIKIIDLHNNNGIAIGTRVEIHIPIT